MIELLIICILLIAFIVWQNYEWVKERQKLLDRVQSSSLVEYKRICEHKANEKVEQESEDIIEL